MDTDAIEKAAEAIHAKMREELGSATAPFEQERYLGMAQAAYTAIVGDKVLVDREPSEQMLHDGYKASYTPVPAIRATWTAMLNASEGG